MAKQPRLPGVNWHEGEFPRVPEVTSGVAQYAKQSGFKYSRRGVSSAKADPDVVMGVGNQVRAQQGVANTAPMDPEMSQSYEALKTHIGRQFDHLTRPREQGGMGVNVEVSGQDPYPNPRAMREDFVTNRRLKVLSTEATGGTGSPLSNEDNDRFRAVHDAFGHLATGRNFSRHGETAALESHMQIFPPETHLALTGELRGQNSYLISHGDFPENKPYKLEPWATASKPKIPSQTVSGRQFGKQGKLF